MRLTGFAVVGVVVLAAVVGVAPPVAAGEKNIVLEVRLHAVDGTQHVLADKVSYGRSKLEGTTTWGSKSASVEWLCSYSSDGGRGPTHDLVTITRSDGSVLGLSITGDATSQRLTGTVDVLGGTGSLAGASGTGTVVGSRGKATLDLTVSTPGRTTRSTAMRGVGC